VRGAVILDAGETGRRMLRLSIRNPLGAWGASPAAVRGGQGLLRPRGLQPVSEVTLKHEDARRRIRRASVADRSRVSLPGRLRLARLWRVIGRMPKTPFAREGCLPTHRGHKVEKDAAGVLIAGSGLPAEDFYLSMTVGSQGRAATIKNALSETARFGLTANAAQDVVAEIRAEVTHWRDEFNAAGVNEHDMSLFEPSFDSPQLYAEPKAT